MVILGISITHDGTLSVIKDGEHIFSMAEERMNRIKAYIGFPFQVLRYVVKKRIVESKEIDRVVVSSSVFLKEWAFTYAFQLTEKKKYYDLQNQEKPTDFFIDDKEYLQISNADDCKKYVDKKIKGLLHEVGIEAPIEYVNHHMAHAASAYYSSGHKKALAITMDGEGDLLSATVNICDNGQIKRISATADRDSAGYLYSEVTRACGFKISRHEGKITGLAAYGDYKKYEECFDKLVQVKNGKLAYVNPVGYNIKDRIHNKLLKLVGKTRYIGAAELIRRCGELSNEDLSASIQHLLEKKIVEIAAYWVKKTNIKDVVLAGGVFANVKFNQYISEIPDVNSIFIFPDMGDGGNAYGAAAYSYYKELELKPDGIKNVFFGPEFSNAYIGEMLENHKDQVEYHLSEDVYKETAQLVSENKIIGWFQGRMEYGPRALGNRSIIASPVDATINKWLNDRMKRTEFMPFAPSCLFEHADTLFEIPKESLKFPAQFMTITFKMKKEWANKAPAVSHVDQTARPQLVTEEGNLKFYKVLKEYYKITGLPLFINTSFNVHEEPIVCKPEEGLKSLLSGVIDYFCVGDYVCKLKNS